MLCLANSTPRTLALPLPPPRWTVKGSIIMDMDKKSMQRRRIVASGGGSSSSTQICPHTTILAMVRLPDELMNSPDPVPRPKSSPPDFPEFKYQEIPPSKVTRNTRSLTDGHPRRPYRDKAEFDGSSASMHNPKNQHQYEGHGDGSHVSNSPSSGAGTSSGCREREMRDKPRLLIAKENRQQGKWRRPQIKERSGRSYELAKNLKEHSERSGWCRLPKGFKKYSEKSGGPAKNLEEHSHRKDGYAKNLKHHSKRSVKLAQILRRHPERSIKLAQNLREHSEKNTNCAKNLEEHPGRNELTKHIEQYSKRNAQLANDLEKHLGSAKLTKNFNGSSGWLQRLFAQGVSILHQQNFSLECFYETTAERKLSLPGRIASVVDTKESVEEESRNADEIRVVIRQAIKGTLQKMERPRSSLVGGDSEDS
ncbi:hypothetical protein BU17DRAFT_83636 [Hysterangium stoloniferum]|nr:hypothetical protein BU17DRAFT_83636 [Hysterangium stoloniferum]